MICISRVILFALYIMTSVQRAHVGKDLRRTIGAVPLETSCSLHAPWSPWIAAVMPKGVCIAEPQSTLLKWPSSGTDFTSSWLSLASTASVKEQGSSLLLAQLWRWQTKLTHLKPFHFFKKKKCMWYFFSATSKNGPFIKKQHRPLIWHHCIIPHPCNLKPKRLSQNNNLNYYFLFQSEVGSHTVFQIMVWIRVPY